MTSQNKYSFKNVPLDDSKVWDLFASGDTLGVFQLEKQLGQDWSRKMEPKTIEDLAVLISILRPGPLESLMSENVIDVKNNGKEPEYICDKLIPILKNSYGSLVYQEGLIQISRDIAGFSEEEGDTLRAACSKKKPELMAKLKPKFIQGCIDNSKLSKELSEEIFGWIEKSQRYSFSKSHAVPYALNAYFSAYQKVHYPTEFYTVWLNYSDNKPDPKQEVYNLVQNAKKNGIDIMPPALSSREADFYIIEKGQIGFGLKHIRGVGQKALDKFEKLAPYILSFDDFIRCTKTIGKGCSESLIKSGACDEFEMSRSYMLAALYCIYGDNKSKKRAFTKLTTKEFSFFEDTVQDLGVISTLELMIEKKICSKGRLDAIEAKIEYLNSMRAIKDTVDQKSIWEKLYLGINVSCSAIDDKTKWGRNLIVCNDQEELEDRDDFTVYGVIDNIIERKTGPKSKTPGSKYCYITISDHSGAIKDMVAWPETYEQYKEDIRENACVGIEAKKNIWNNRIQFPIKSIRTV